MNFRILFWAMNLLVLVNPRPLATRHADRYGYIKYRLCNGQTCDKCEIEVSRHQAKTHMGRICQLIKKIRGCCEGSILIH